MRTANWLFLASLAGCALSLPTPNNLDSRDLTVGLGVSVNLGGIIEAVLSGNINVGIFAGLSAKAAAALEVAVLGCKATVVDIGVRAEIKAWLLGPGLNVLDAALHAALLDWCDATDGAVLSVDVIAGLAVYAPLWAQIAAEASLTATVDGIVDIADLIKADVALTVDAQASLLAFLSAAVNVDLDLKVKAGLAVCAAGGVVTSLSADVKAALLAWLNSPACTLDVHLKASVLAWINVDVDVNVVAAVESLTADAAKLVSVGGYIVSRVEATTGALVDSAQSALAALLNTHIGVSIDADVLASLKVCAQGGLATSLSVDARVALIAWLRSALCPLTAELKAVVLLWLSFAAAAEKTALSLPAAHVAAIHSFLMSPAALDLSLDVRAALAAILSGEGLLSVTVDVWAAVSVLLSGLVGIDLHLGLDVLLWAWLGGVNVLGGPAVVTIA